MRLACLLILLVVSIDFPLLLSNLCVNKGYDADERLLDVGDIARMPIRSVGPSPSPTRAAAAVGGVVTGEGMMEPSRKELKAKAKAERRAKRKAKEVEVVEDLMEM